MVRFDGDGVLALLSGLSVAFVLVLSDLMVCVCWFHGSS